MTTCPHSLLVEVDLAKAEWVVSAYAAQATAMIEVVESKQDTHLVTARMISGAPDAYILEEEEKLGHTTSAVELEKGRRELCADPAWFAPRTMTMRQAGKRCNHGLNYGMQAQRFSLTTGTPIEDATRMVESYHRAYPGLRKWHNRIEEQLHRDRTMRNAFGHKRIFRDRFSTDLILQAIAWEPQSTIATLTNRGLTRIYESGVLEKGFSRLELPESFYRERAPYDPLAQVHDSIAGQAFPGNWEELLLICQTLEQLMAEPVTLHGREFTVGRDIKIGRNWRDMHSVDLARGVGALTSAWEKGRELA